MDSVCSVHRVVYMIFYEESEFLGPFFWNFGACADSVYQALLPSLTLLKPLTMVYVTSSSQIRVFGAYGDLGYTCTL